MVKRSHGINVHNLIQQIENHPQRKALQSDLQQNRAFNPFNAKSKDAIKVAGNTELCEIVDVEPKSQCRACLTYWNVGIVCCTCGHLLEDDTTGIKKYISSVLDLFSSRTSTSGRAGHTVTSTGRRLQRIPHGKTTSRCRKKHYEDIHDRFNRDTTFRKTMIELDRFENVILEMDRPGLPCGSIPSEPSLPLNVVTKMKTKPTQLLSRVSKERLGILWLQKRVQCPKSVSYNHPS